MACRLIAIVLVSILSLRVGAQPPADANRAGEVSIQPVTFAEVRAASQACDEPQWISLRQLHRDKLGIDLDRQADFNRYGQVHDLLIARRTSLGDFALEGLAHCYYSARPNGSGGSILIEIQIVATGIDLDGRPTPLLNDGHMDGLVAWVPNAEGRSKVPDPLGPTLTLDPKHGRSVTHDAQFRIGVGLYQGKPATGHRDGVLFSVAGTADHFASQTPGALAKQITWLGPVKTFRTHFFLDNEGNWQWKDELRGIDRKGKIPAQ